MMDLLRDEVRYVIVICKFVGICVIVVMGDNKVYLWWYYVFVFICFFSYFVFVFEDLSFM